MKKILALTTLLTSTLLHAHNPYYSNFFNYNPMFDDGFWRNIEHQFQYFDHQMNKLKRDGNAIKTTSKQYFDKDTNNYIIKIKTSGINKDNFDISMHQDKLIIKAKQSSKDDNNSTSSYFSQIVSIPTDGNVEKITAAFKNDVLMVSIPKLDKPNAQVRKIIIQ